ncbi:MAG: cytidylate kinase-like family protein [Clostridiales bacterium]|nr:cytidylate kinase-like family protein [Candidatus Coliplasma caballi]
MKVITIGREYGSGGRTIGKMVAQKLGIPYYDRELVDEAAKRSGLAVEAIEENDQVVTRSFLYDLAIGTSYGYVNQTGIPLDLNTQVFLAQREAILKFAEQPCVIVGRCADYILRDREDLLRVFVYADKKARLDRIVKEYGEDPAKAEKLLAQSDKRRARHYEEFTDSIWGARRNYDVLLNSATLGLEHTAEIICRMAE